MRTSALLLQFGLAATAAAQIAPPSWGVVQHAGNRAVEIQGLPGSWLAVPASLGPVDAVASSPSQLCWTRDGALNIRDRQTGATRTIAVPAGPARFAFDSQGALAAVWFTAAGQLYTAAAGWAPVLSIPSARPNCWTCRTRARAPSNSCCALPAPGVARRRKRPRIALAQESRSRCAPPPSPTCTCWWLIR
jgi:hypothetical protein